ncbi:MAG: cupin domain-containing protein [Acidimicrobiales bacterium]
MAALARCVGDVEEFLAQSWSRAPRLQRNGDPGRFAGVFTVDDVDRFIATLPRLPEFRLVRDGKPLEPSSYTKTTKVGGKEVTGVGDPGRIYREFTAGATIVLQSLHRWNVAVGRFCRDLELALTHPAQANAYVTPPHERGLGVHHDTHDVLVLQLAGQKHWKVYDPVFEDPLPAQTWSSGDEPGPPILDVVMEPGDCLYLPRGFPHAASSGDSVTAHLTIGLLVLTVQDVVRELLARTVDEPRFRRSLRAGFAGSDGEFAGDVAAVVADLIPLLERTNAEAVADRIAGRFWSTRPALLAGHLGQLLAVDGLGDRSKVRRRPGSICRLSSEPAPGGRLVIDLGDRRLLLPAALEPAVRRLSTGQTLAVADLAGELDHGSRLVLVRRLLTEGLLEVVD